MNFSDFPKNSWEKEINKSIEDKTGYPYNKFIHITSFGGWIGNFWWVNRDPSNLKCFKLSWIGSFGFDGKPQFILGFE